MTVLRLDRLFGQTLRTAPADVDVESHRLLLRAGMVRQLGSGIFTYMPLGWRSIRRIEQIIREEIDGIGGQEMNMPVVHPADLWQRTGRWHSVDATMVRFHDRAERDMVLGMTHEEVVTDLAAREILSWRQLPQLVYQMQTKFRDEPRPRAGLIRTREFIMKDSYSFDRDEDGLRVQYDAHHEAYLRIFRRCGLDSVISVRSDSGMMGGSVAHEFMFPASIGEDTLVRCTGCGEAANLQVARFVKSAIDGGAAAPLERVETPGRQTIDELCEFLGIRPEQTAKAVFFTATFAGDDGSRDERLLMAMVRGDHEVNETKLANAARAIDLRPATAEEIRATGAEPGYASPIGIDRARAVVVVDDLLMESANVVSGANETDVHFRNVNAERDFAPDHVADIVAAHEGAGCVSCCGTLTLFRGVEVGNIFQLGTRYSTALGALYTDESGEQRPVVMGSYGIGVGRLLACVAEQHHDDRGLTWPAAVSPADVHVVVLGDTGSAADDLVNALSAAGLDLLVDTREASAGVKFADADLVGAPVRATVSPRSLAAGGVELRDRRSGETQVVASADAVAAARAIVQR